MRMCATLARALTLYFGVNLNLSQKNEITVIGQDSCEKAAFR